MKVELIDHMGSDLSVVNAARVSFDKESVWNCCSAYEDGGDCKCEQRYLCDKDANLIRFLARGLTAEDFDTFVKGVAGAGFIFTAYEKEEFKDKQLARLIDLLWTWRRTPAHFAPFAHPHVTFRIKAPIFVARQLGKHQVGMVWSEVSRRYVDSEPEFYTPPVWRKRAANVKQGSSDETVELQEHYGLDKANMDVQLKYLLNDAQGVYRRLVAIGCCPEQARMVLPQSMMTEWIWTGSLYGWANVFNQRKPGSHAQRETWEIATMIDEHMGRLFPVSWEALTR